MFSGVMLVNVSFKSFIITSDATFVFSFSPTHSIGVMSLSNNCVIFLFASWDVSQNKFLLSLWPTREYLTPKDFSCSADTSPVYDPFP